MHLGHEEPNNYVVLFPGRENTRRGTAFGERITCSFSACSVSAWPGGNSRRRGEKHENSLLG